MKIYTIRLQKKTRMILLACAVAAILLVLLIALPTRSVASSGTPVLFSDIETNEDRIRLLSACGWEVSPEPLLIQEVQLPETAEGVFSEYAALQREQGFPLEKHLGRKVKCYVYLVENSGEESGALATLLISKGRVVGGDVTGRAAESKIGKLVNKM